MTNYSSMGETKHNLFVPFALQQDGKLESGIVPTSLDIKKPAIIREIIQ